jgi:hypothetical protein
MIKQLVIYLLMISLAGWAFAENQITNLDGNQRISAANLKSSHNQANQSVWSDLARMDLVRRANSLIDIELPLQASDAAKALTAEIESLWNSGNHDQALAIFSQLQNEVGGNRMAIGVSWKTPVISGTNNSTILWERDVQVNYQDSVYATSLNVHQPTGNMFIVLLLQDGPYQLLSVNHSSNGGATWAETFYWVSPDILPSMGAAVMGNRCYVAYPFYNSVRLKCFDVIDGHSQEFVDSTSTVTALTIGATDSIKEISLVSNQNATNNRLYCLAISSQGQLIYQWADYTAIVWHAINTGIGNADRGLDATFNEQFGNCYLLISYIDQTDNLNVFGRQNQAGPDQDEAGNLGR